MAFEVEGKLYKKFDTAQVTDTFKKREFILEIEDGAYTQLIKFQLTQANCEKLDPYNEGGQIKVTFNLRGREYKKGDQVSYFTNLDAWRLENVSSEAPGAGSDGSADMAFPTASDEPASDDMDDLPF